MNPLVCDTGDIFAEEWVSEVDIAPSSQAQSHNIVLGLCVSPQHGRRINAGALALLSISLSYAASSVTNALGVADAIGIIFESPHPGETMGKSTISLLWVEAI